MRNQTFSEIYDQIAAAVEQAQQAHAAYSAAIKQAVERKEGRLRQADNQAERHREWANKQAEALTDAQASGRSVAEAAGVELPAYTGQAKGGALTKAPRSGLELAVASAQTAVEQIWAGNQILERLQARRQRIVGGIIIAVLAVIIGIVSFVNVQIENRRAAATAEATRVASAATQGAIATATMAATQTRIAIATLEAEGGAQRTIELPNGMEVIQVFVPGSTFSMGSIEGSLDEQPAHDVTLDSFWINQTEVTNAQYAGCVADGECRASTYANDSRFNGANYPVVGVNWHNAAAYCAWAGGRLPTEAEWEYAARGPKATTYPWGDEAPSCSIANYKSCVGTTTAVGSYPNGASWIGALDMAGNVREWVNDWYAKNYYASSPAENPTGPADGQIKALRGGAWSVNDQYVRAAIRSGDGPASTGGSVGFRCAQE